MGKDYGQITSLKIAGAAFGAIGDIFKHIFAKAWFILVLPVLAAFFLWSSFTIRIWRWLNERRDSVLYVVFIIH